MSTGGDPAESPTPPLTIPPPPAASTAAPTGSLAAAGGGAGLGMLLAALVTVMPDGPAKLVATAGVPLAAVLLTRLLDGVARMYNRRNRRREWAAAVAAVHAFIDDALANNSLTPKERVYFQAAQRDIRRAELEERRADLTAASRAKRDS